MNTVEEKQGLRKKIKIVLAALSEEERNLSSQKVFEKIEQLEIYRQSKNIMVYWSFGTELPSHPFVKKASFEKQVYLPRLCEGEIEMVKFRGQEQMQKTEPFGIEEPIGESMPNLEILDLIIVPGLAFDRVGNRLGRGKAYYDKFLPKTKAYRIGVAYSCQISESIPHDANDIKMHEVIAY